jgi:hypothetical protein
MAVWQRVWGIAALCLVLGLVFLAWLISALREL